MGKNFIYSKLKKAFIEYQISKPLLLFGLFFIHISFAFSQNQKVSGSVTDANTGEVLIGVSIKIEGTTQGTITDNNGFFSFESVNPDAVLIFSYIGYVTEKVNVAAQTAINVAMIPDITKLDQIVVVGYNTTKRKNLASSVAVINNKTLTNLATTDVGQALQGKIAGVQVTNNNGDPGTGTKVIIRGIGSFTSSAPLFVIDGISGGDINAVSPQDIQSITVLKDAATTAIYGAAAANGVVIITTKDGIKGQMKVSYEGSYGISTVGKKMKLLNAEQYVDLVSDIQTNNNLTLTDSLNSPTYALVDRTDWQNEIFRDAPVMDHNLRLSGGGEYATYSFSVGYLDQKSIIIDSRFKRINFNAKLSQNILQNRVRLGQNFRIKNEITDGSTASLFDALRMPPYLSVYDPSVVGGYSRTEKTRDLNDANNPLASVYLSPQNKRVLAAELDLYGEVDIFKGLVFKSQARISAGNSHNQTFNYPVEAGNFTRSTANMTESYSYNYGLLLENFFAYDRTFGIHNVSLTAGNTYQPSGYYRQLSVAGSDFTSTDIQNIGLANTKTITGSSVNGSKSRLSYFGRMGYTLSDKYVINATIRRDASSVFGSNNQWGTFYGLGGAWTVSGESFMKSIPAIDNLKLRVSYGITGNDNIPMFLTGKTVWKGSSNNIVYSFGDNDGTYFYGATINSVPNPDLKWEETAQTDIGFDLSLFRKLNIVFDYFKRNNKNLLIETTLPLSTGIGNTGATPSMWVNAASMKNTGFEFSITYNGNISDFKWDINFNATYNTNEVTALGTMGDTPINQGDFGVGSSTRTDIGHPLASFYGYKVDHVAIDQADIDRLNDIAEAHGFTVYQDGLLPGDRIYKDVSGDGHIDDKDRTFIGNPSPKWQYGLILNGEYKGLDLQIMLQGLAGVDVVNGGRSWFEGMTRPFNSFSTVLDRWREPGDVAPLPAAGQNPGKNTQFSDWYVEKGDYMRIKNITMGYTLPSRILKNYNVRVYLALQNILTFTKYSGYDPEISSYVDATDNRGYVFQHGIDYGQHPNPRIYRIGLQLNF